MRRPGPLPAEQTAKPEPAPRRTSGRRAPAATTADAENSAPASEQPPADELFGGPDILPAPRPLGSTAPGRAPARPMAAPEALSAPPTDRPADVERDESEDDPTGIGVRDVWAAARARRRALRAEVRRFTVRQRRRRMLWGGTLAALLLLVIGTLGAAYSPLFAVEQVSVVGTSTLDAGAVEAALAGQIGTPLPLVDSSSVKAVLVTFPLVESYTLEARPPHELVVRIVERTPIGSIQSAAGYTLVDAAGVALSTTPEPAAGHPVIVATGGVGSDAFDAIGTVFRSLPDDIRGQVTQMTATTANDVTLTLGGTGTEVVWGNADKSAKKAFVLAKAMTARPPDGVSSYDVSSPDTVVVR
ncbi:FtsQ-type POTRA domain-containing protein [Microbacterium paulum]